MLYPTHIAAGALAGAMVVKLTSAPPKLWPLIIGTSMLASLVPDFDKRGSKASRTVPGSGFIIGAITSHRGFLHSLAAIALLSAGLYLFWPGLPKEVLFAFTAGALSHPLVDTINPQGVQWLWPLNVKLSLARILPWPFSFTTGSKIEKGIFQPMLWFLTVWLLLGDKVKSFM
ncbi:metal-dependent hydrolase [Desulforamulus aquiferis]|uniref:Metal-dependent hydrolase n=1 Tax=Desulforamulus aquiferis TaxID=1397668 RepID=A0AAW7Z910_9FIRM|nr:metal-dependent hydrolase [Desulforamulus aquiferis]MDO7785788.1 metal-dependent hydrolase [Desulforamulus aquiferis]